jgi:hypothetical protein
MAKDFFDKDLAPSGDADRAEPAARPAGGDSFYNRQKQVLPEQVSQTADEIERLRHRQEELERRKQALLEQRRRMEAYEQGRRDMLDKMGRSAVMLEREGEQASRMAALCAETRTLFQNLQKELESIESAKWDEQDYERELTRALAQIESASLAYRKAMDRVNATAWHRAGEEGASVDLGGLAGGNDLPRTFQHWIVAGFAFSLPMILVAILLFVVYVALFGR